MTSIPDDKPLSIDQLSRTLALVQRAQDGDTMSWSELDARMRPWLLAQLGGRNLPKSVDPDDVIQEVLMYVHQSFDRFHVDPQAAFRGWLLKILINKLTDLHRRANAQKRGGGDERLFGDIDSERAPEELAPTESEEPSRAAGGLEIRRELDGAIAQLSDEYKTVLELREEQQLEFEDVAARMGHKRAEAARSLYRRARARRRELMRIFEDTEQRRVS